MRRVFGKLWAPVSWMLEAAILLQLFLGDYVQAGVVAFLLIANAAIGFFQGARAQATLDALKSRLTLVAAVQRDGVWTTVPAATLVAGDSQPGKMAHSSSAVDLMLISLLAVNSVLMRPFAIAIVAGMFAAAIIFASLLDSVKVILFRRFKIA